MFGIGMSEMLIILAVALVVFGPQKLPEVAKTLAKGLRELRKAGDDLKASVDLGLDDDRPRPKRSFKPSQDDTPIAPAAIAGSDLATTTPTGTADSELRVQAPPGILSQGSLFPDAPPSSSASSPPSSAASSPPSSAASSPPSSSAEAPPPETGVNKSSA